MAIPKLHPGVTPASIQQLLLVDIPDFNHTVGLLSAWERQTADNPWQKRFDVPVSVGKQGATFGQGWVQWSDTVEEKVEGDQKTPLGLFPLIGTYGYGAAANHFHMPHLQVQEWHKCVDDPNSRYYNKIVDERVAEKDWQTAEDMLRDDHLYKWGIVVGYNTHPPHPGKGSAIFLHLWRNPGKPTAGCTAMSEENMWQLLAWLRPEAKPALLQTTAHLRTHLLQACGWSLPD